MTAIEKSIRNILRLKGIRWGIGMIGALWLGIMPVSADEGFWLFSAVPKEKIERLFGVAPSDEFLTRLQRSVVRLDLGATGSFVSPDGLVMTNYHCVFGALGRLDSPSNRYLADGFYAAAPEEEIRCPGLELAVCVRFEDVTHRIELSEDDNLIPDRLSPNNLTPDHLSSDRRRELRRRRIEEMEKTESDRTGLVCKVESFFEGARHFLYYYRRFDDVRLVFAPEKNVGLFGGDADNFEYPRYNFDVAFLRVYEDGRPFRPNDYLTWSRNSASDGTPVFAVGNPGRSNRFKTAEHLDYFRNDLLPSQLKSLRRSEALAKRLAASDEKNKAAIEKELFYLQNQIKARSGQLEALNDPSVFASCRAADDAARRALEADGMTPLPEGGDGGHNDSPWSEIADALDDGRRNLLPNRLFVTEGNFDPVLLRTARRILLFVTESNKPEAERLPGYQEAHLAARRGEILADPIFDEASETVRLADKFDLWQKWPDREGTPLEFDISPEDEASKLLRSTRLTEADFRRRLIEGGGDAIRRSNDPLVVLAAWIEERLAGPARAHQREIDRRLAACYAVLTPARYALYGDAIYPEANFTLRLSYGTVSGYRDRHGRPVPSETTMDEAFAHAEKHDRTGVYSLSSKWFDHRSELNPATPLNRISTNDILGGNSGSPLLNGRGEIVGLVFDGNRAGLALNFLFTDHEARAVSVDSAAVIEALRIIYDAKRILNEIEWGDDHDP